MRISVIIPCYNEEEFIGQAIGSLHAQTHLPDEIVVVDDGSSDKSAQIAERFGERVKVLKNRVKGVQNARNFGASHASGDALMFFDADDVLGPAAMDSLMTRLEKNPAGIAACPWYRLEKKNGKWIKTPRSCPDLVEERDYLSGWIREVYHPPCSILWSRVAYDQTGGWDPAVKVNQDGDLIMRALANGSELMITNTGSSFYRRTRENQASNSISAGRFSREGRKSQIYVLQKLAGSLDEKGKLKSYRYPITETLNSIRKKCGGRYPELAEECSNLIKRYGEPGYLQVFRKVNERFGSVLQFGKTRVAGALSQLGLHRVRKSLARIKNRGWSAQTDDKKPFVQNSHPEAEIGEEINYGLREYRKVWSDS